MSNHFQQILFLTYPSFFYIHIYLIENHYS